MLGIIFIKAFVDMDLSYTYLDGIGVGNSIEIGLTKEDVDFICHSGSNDVEVAEVSKKEYIQKQLKGHQFKKLHNIVSYRIASDGKDIRTRKQVEEYIVWLAAWNIFDET